MSWWANAEVTTEIAVALSSAAWTDTCHIRLALQSALLSEAVWWWYQLTVRWWSWVQIRIHEVNLSNSNNGNS